VLVLTFDYLKVNILKVHFFTSLR